MYIVNNYTFFLSS